MKRSSQPRRVHGFTLIELLVVVTIIVVLAAVLIPVTKTAREGARRAKCASNLHQIYQGAMAYAARYDGAIPGVVYPFMHDTFSSENFPWADGMFQEMFRYIDGRLYRCPGDFSASPYEPTADDDWRDRPSTGPGRADYAPDRTLNHTSYFIFMGVADHPDSICTAAEGYPAAPKTGNWNRYPPRISPVSPRGYQCKRGCIYDNTLFSGTVHLAHLKDVGSPKQILMMDRHYSELQTGFYVDYGAASAMAGKLVSNHPYAKQSTGNPILVYAAGVNMLLADGSVRWMDTRNEETATSGKTLKVQYHYEASGSVFQIYVDPDLDRKKWKKS